MDTIREEPEILETLGLTLEEVEKYIELQKERKKNDKMFSDVIVCKTYKDFDKQVQLIRQEGIGNNKRKVLIEQNSDRHIAFYIFFKNPNGGLDVFTHHTDGYYKRDGQKILIDNYKIKIQSDSVSCGVVALECIKHLTYDWYKKNIENIKKTTEDTGIIDNKVLPAQVLKYWQSVEGLKTNFPEIYNSLIRKKRVKFVESLKKERNYALPHKAVIISKYNDYLDKKISETEFNKPTFIKNTLKLREKEIEEQEKEIKLVADELYLVAEKFDKNISRGLVKEDECEKIDRLLKDLDVKLRKRYRKEFTGRPFFNMLDSNYHVTHLLKISERLIERYDKQNNQSCFEISKEWVEKYKTQIELMNGIRQQVENFHHDLQIWLSSKQIIDRKKCDTFEKVLLKTLKQLEKFNKCKVEEVFLNAEFCKYGIRLDKILLDFLAKKCCQEDKTAKLYDMISKQVKVVRQEKYLKIKDELSKNNKQINQELVKVSQKTETENIKKQDRSTTIKKMRDKLKFNPEFHKEIKVQLPPKSDTLSMPNFEKTIISKIKNDDNSKNEEHSGYNHNRRNGVQNEESLWGKIKSIFSCCNYDLNNEKDNEIAF